jgi:hypothetical protein
VAHDAEKLDGATDLIVTPATGRATPTRQERLDSDAGPDANGYCSPVELCHLTGDLVARTDFGWRKRALEPIQVTAADAAAAYSHQYLTGTHRWARKIPELETSVFGAKRGSHEQSLL